MCISVMTTNHQTARIQYIMKTQCIPNIRQRTMSDKITENIQDAPIIQTSEHGFNKEFKKLRKEFLYRKWLNMKKQGLLEILTSKNAIVVKILLTIYLKYGVDTNRKMKSVLHQPYTNLQKARRKLESCDERGMCVLVLYYYHYSFFLFHGRLASSQMSTI